MSIPGYAPSKGADCGHLDAAVRDVEAGLKRAVLGFRLVQDHCEGVTRAEVSCAVGAESTKAWEGCVHPPDAR